MQKDLTKQNLGNIASNFKHIAMFLSAENWQLKIPRVNKFIADTKELALHVKIDSKNILKLFNNFCDRETFEDNKVAAEESLLLSVRFQNLANIT